MRWRLRRGWRSRQWFLTIETFRSIHKAEGSDLAHFATDGFDEGIQSLGQLVSQGSGQSRIVVVTGRWGRALDGFGAERSDVRQ